MKYLTPAYCLRFLYVARELIEWIFQTAQPGDTHIAGIEARSLISWPDMMNTADFWGRFSSCFSQILAILVSQQLAIHSCIVGLLRRNVARTQLKVNSSYERVDSACADNSDAIRTLRSECPNCSTDQTLCSPGSNSDSLRSSCNYCFLWSSHSLRVVNSEVFRFLPTAKP